MKMTAPRSNQNSIRNELDRIEANMASVADRRAALRARLKDSRAKVAHGQRAQLRDVLEAEELAMWQIDGYRSLAEWVGARLSVSEWMARRIVNAARSLGSLPLTDAAFEAGELTLEQVVELCRFATPTTEKSLVKWARRVKPKAIRHRADVETKKSLNETVDVDRSRFLHHWWMSDGRLGIEGAFPPDQGAAIAKTLDRLADRMPDIVDQDDLSMTPPEAALEIRRADALYALASARIANDQDADRATVVVHANFDALAHGGRGCEIESGPAIHSETALRLSCDCRLEMNLHNELGEIVGIGRVDRTPPPWIKRALRVRDKGCTFPGCEAKRFLHAHHIEHWARGGPTDLSNLTLVCVFHHKLVHEYGWNVELGRSGLTRWLRPGGQLFNPDRASPEQQKLRVA